MTGRAGRTAEILADLATQGPAIGWPAGLVDTCQRSTAVTGVGLAVMDADGVGGLVAATDGVAQRMEDLQFSLGEGPCRDAARSGVPVLVPDLRDTAPHRWPAYVPGALDQGIRAVFTFPLRVGSTAIGVLDLYRARDGDLTGAQFDAAAAFADAATAVLLHLQYSGTPARGAGAEPDGSTPDGEFPPPQHLTKVLDRRAVVHQAAGMISVQLKTPPADALVRLRAHSFAVDRPIMEVATDVVARRLRFDDSDAGTSTTPWPPPPDTQPTGDGHPHD